jgi:hypothetical protein
MLKKMSVVLGAVSILAAVACGSSGSGQSQDCKDYVACSYKTGVTSGSLDSSYGPNGSCWTTTSTGDSCTAACKSANDSFKSTGLGADAGCTFGM